MFADQVETLGTYKYPDSFAGIRFTSAGVTDVYALPASDSQFIRAIHGMNKGGYPVDIVGVSRSYNQLMAINAKVDAANKRMLEMGIRLSQSWPDPSSGSVFVAVAKPASGDVSKLTSTLGRPVTAATYARTVSEFLRSEFGSAVKLSSAGGIIWKTAGRNNDVAPYYNGDQIYGGGYTCTGGFNMVGNASGHTFMYTAGHCPAGTWKTQAQTIGTTSTDYLGACNSEDDYQSIYLPHGGLDAVWGAGGSLYTVVGSLLPAPGTAITMDGSVTNEVRFNTVIAINATIYNIYDSIHECFYNAAPSIEAYNPAGHIICQGGDSGGPVIQHVGSTNNVEAVGTIVAYGSYDGLPAGSYCVTTQIGSVELETNTTLLTG